MEAHKHHQYLVDKVKHLSEKKSDFVWITLGFTPEGERVRKRFRLPDGNEDCCEALVVFKGKLLFVYLNYGSSPPQFWDITPSRGVYAGETKGLYLNEKIKVKAVTMDD